MIPQDCYEINKVITESEKELKKHFEGCYRKTSPQYETANGLAVLHGD